MRIIWNSLDGQFEAQFQAGDNWRTDIEAAKAAGFRCTGPPDWKWYTAKVEPLKYLREHRPPELTIMVDALDQFLKMSAQAEANAAVLAKLAEFKKQQKAEKKKVQREHIEKIQIGEASYDAEIDGPIPEYWVGKEFITREDLPAEILAKYVRGPAILRELEHKQCVLCDDPVYCYEKQDPPTCLSCEISLDK